MNIAWGLVLILIAAPAPAALYKWIDATGRVQYSDTPPPPNAKQVEERRIIRNTIETQGTPFAVQEAAKRNPVTVWMNDCGELCDRARAFLAQRGVPHTLRNPSRQTEQEDWKRVSGGDNSVPLFLIGSRPPIKGFDEAQWSAALDEAGYPRNAPAIKPQPVPTDPPPPSPAAAPAPAQAAAKPQAGEGK